METPNTTSLSGWWQRLGVKESELVRVFRSFNAYAAAFRQESMAHENQNDQG
jgi:hypothetical protein